MILGACHFNDTHKDLSPIISREASQQQEKLACLLKPKREQFSEPSIIKIKPNSLHFEHTSTQESLGIHGCLDASWVQEELSKRELHPTEEEDESEENGELHSEKKKTETRGVNGIHGDARQEDTTTNFQDDIDGVAALLASLKAITKQRDLHKGSRLHADIVKMGLLEKNVFVGNALVNMYAKCGALEKAWDVFDKLSVPNVVSWTALIAGYAQHGHTEEAWNCFQRMQHGGISPNLVTFVCILKACRTIGAVKKGLLLHAQIVIDGLLDEDIQVGTALVDMYAKCGLLREAQEVFDELLVRDVVTWTTLIIGYAQYGHGEKALHVFNRMQDEGFSPNEITFTCALKACGTIEATHKGQQLHAQIVKEHVPEQNIVVANALIDMYAKCGALSKAQEVFDKLCVRNEVSWTALIAGYAQLGHGEKALNNFEQMQLQGFFPNEITLVCILTACGSIGALDKGQEVHAKIVREELLEENIQVANALIDMYAKCGCFEKAHGVVEQLQGRDMVSWNALISAYVQSGLDDEAFSCLEQMQLDTFHPDAVTFVCLLKACGSLGAADKGQELHIEIDKEGWLENNSMVVVALIDMYAKCGMLSEAQIVFDKLSVRDTVSWNALMAGYAQLGKDEVVFHLLNNMIGEGTKPDLVTFTIVLNTCCHRGLLDKGQFYFTNIHTAYGIIPTLSHHTCIIDLFGRVGHLDKVVAIIEEMSFLPDFTMWHTLFSACQIWGNFKLGRVAFDCTSQKDENHTSAFVCLSNIFAAGGWQEDAKVS